MSKLPRAVTARAVAPWTWRRALRDHGPRSQSVLLTLLIIQTFMDRDGYAFPGQSLIAAGARTSTRSVKRHIAAAKRMGWLAIEPARRSGQGWRHNAYRACVPDSLQLDELDEEIAERVTDVFGDVTEGEDTIVSPRRDEGGDIQRSNVGTSDAEGGDTGRQKVGTQYCPTNSRSEELPLKNSHQEEAQFAEDSEPRRVIRDDRLPAEGSTRSSDISIPAPRAAAAHPTLPSLSQLLAQSGSRRARPRVRRRYHAMTSQQGALRGERSLQQQSVEVD